MVFSRVSLHDLKQAFVAALPIVAGYVVLGIPCGILGVQAGMSVLQVVLMSLFFYSGAGQYLIPNLWMAGVPITSIVASVSLVNLRQILYAASMSRFSEGAGKRLSFLFAATMTDESFGINLGRFTAEGAQERWTVSRATLVNLFSLVTWILANAAGAILGSLLAVPTALASFAMTAIFICLLFMQRFTPPAIVAAVVAALGVCVCKLVGLSGPAILIGALLGIAAALIVGRKTPSPEHEGGEQ
ncbi:MAG: AzlC family ABC transporter permease [Coriobacteriales bacterium]|nr:AzlC family ABC transporter permease [Coriobacteriales bacterium]